MANRVSRTDIARALREVSILWVKPPDPRRRKAAIRLDPNAALKTSSTIKCSTPPAAPGARHSDDRPEGMAPKYPPAP